MISPQQSRRREAGSVPASRRDRRIMSGKMKTTTARADWIQDRVIERASELRQTAAMIARATDWRVSVDHVRSYLDRRSSMGSHKLQHVLSVLGLTITTGD
jgi:hypothetical protein